MDRKASTRTTLPDVLAEGDDGGDGTKPKVALTRRNMLKKGLGFAVVGAAGGALMAEAKASPALAAGSITEQGAVAPTVVTLTDAAAIAVDASLGNDFRVTIGASRTMENPANPVDGQKIVFQITQGPTGSSTLTWGSSYEFSTSLPQPTLSTAAGDTDLLAFIYNAAKGKWLLAAFVSGFATAVVTQPGGTFRLFSSTNGPSNATPYSGAIVAGVMFEVTTGNCWLDGFWWWVCPSGQSTSAQTFALWQLYGADAGTLVGAATVTSGTLTAGQWNYVPLTVPIPLTSGAAYIAATGLNGDFPTTSNQYGAGQPYVSGITSGPLTAFSDTSGSLPGPFGVSQGLFSVAGENPAVNMPGEGFESSNMWIDVQVATTAPTGASYRLWPSYPTPPGGVNSETVGYTLATEFQLSETCTLDRIWFYSPGGATALPSQCGIWNVATQGLVAGTDEAAPAWSGPAGSGWVACSYSGVTLPAGDYKVAVFYGGGSPWFQATTNYWASGGQGGNGVANGAVAAPGAAAATAPGQGTYNQATWAYPLTASNGANENFWLDVEVTPA